MRIKTDLENDFAWTMYTRYRKHCDREQVDGGFQHFVKYLVSCGVIRDKTVQRLMVTELYPQALAQSGGRKLEAVAIIAEQTGLCERTINSILTRPELYTSK
jgi:hypothetical protein